MVPLSCESTSAWDIQNRRREGAVPSGAGYSSFSEGMACAEEYETRLLRRAWLVRRLGVADVETA